MRRMWHKRDRWDRITGCAAFFLALPVTLVVLFALFVAGLPKEWDGSGVVVVLVWIVAGAGIDIVLQRLVRRRMSKGAPTSEAPTTILREYRAREDDLTLMAADDLAPLENAGWRITSWKVSHEPEGHMAYLERRFAQSHSPTQREDWVLRVTLSRGQAHRPRTARAD